MTRVLIVTEKSTPALEQRDGGARLVATLRRCLGGAVEVMQFDTVAAPDEGSASFRYLYPIHHIDRFERRLANASFVAARVREVAARYTHILFVHVSMQFGADEATLGGARSVTFPMFLTPSYVAAGELVPPAYTAAERVTLGRTARILTPSHLERRQLVEHYRVPSSRVRVIPRGVDRCVLLPRTGAVPSAPLFCSVGTIKRQKNTVGLIRLFHAIRARHPEARLRIVGPVQDAAYAAEVQEEILRLGLASVVERTGYVHPAQLASALAGAHVHLSASGCETFGRAIFEALAAGVPSIAPLAYNAAAEYLAHAPYARFFASPGAAPAAVDEILANHGALSTMATEVGELFDDDALGHLLVAEVLESEAIGISDFDGTIFHKNDAHRTRRCVEAFQSHQIRVVCSARPVPDLLDTMAAIGATADFVVGWSGAVIAEGTGRVLSRSGFHPVEEEALAARLGTTALRLRDGGVTLQFALRGDARVDAPGARVETYQGVTYCGPWESSKLRATVRLLRKIDWRGRVRAFGDGPHDLELLTYFDGTRICPPGSPPGLIRQAAEIPHADG